MRGLTSWLIDRRWWVIGSWLVVLLALTGVSRVVGPSFEFDVNLDGTESVAALNLLSDHDPAWRGSSLTLAWQAEEGIAAPAAKQSVTRLLTSIGEMDHVSRIVDPWSMPQVAASQVSTDGTVAYATIVLDSRELPEAQVRDLVSRVEATDAPDDGLRVGITGSPIKQTAPPSSTVAEVVGFAIAAIILLLAFGSVLSAALPIVTALVALGAGLAIVDLVTHVVAIPSFAPQMMSLISIGVGIDYALFVVSRHRSGLRQGMTVRASVLHAFDTSGRAVIFAGITVMISILGMVATGIGFLNGLAIATSIGVLATMLVTITLLPALLSVLGLHVLGRRAQRTLRKNGPGDDERSTRWGSWAQAIQRRPWPFIAASVALLVVLCIPVLSLRMSMSDSGAETAESTTRVAYDVMADGFGEGANGPLLLVSEDQAALAGALPGLASRPDVVVVSPVQPTSDGAVFTATLVPVSGPQDAETTRLIADLRDGTLPDQVMVSGLTAVYDDFSAELQARLPWFLIGVLGLSSLLLLVAFRSLAIPAKAAIMNLLAAGASFGVLVAVVQWGWLGPQIGFEATGPVDAFIPIILLAVLFGLSMDYQVFLVSRMREEWVRSHDNARAVTLGLAETGRVITAAALIMIAVFVSFVFGAERVVKIMGLGLAVAIFLDAFVIRSLLVPALMRVLGDWNWWLPAWLDRVTPRITIEPEGEPGGEPDGESAGEPEGAGRVIRS